jgi:hypothetical protein
MYINIGEIAVYNNSQRIPFVGGEVLPPFAASYGWQQLYDGDVGTIAHTNNDQNASITVNLGSPMSIDEILVINRIGGTVRILGCELQALDGARNVIRSWVFKNASNANAHQSGADQYRVGRTTNMVLMAEALGPPPVPAPPVLQPSIQVTPPSNTMNGVRYIRVQRIQPSPKGENYINISGIVVTRGGTQLDLVNGVVKNEWAPGVKYGWENLKGGAKSGNVGFAHTRDEPDSSITVDLGAPNDIDEVVVYNRIDVAWERIVGCELQLLGANEAVVGRWAFKDVGDPAVFTCISSVARGSTGSG